MHTNTHSIRNSILLDLLLISKEYAIQVITDTGRAGLFVPFSDIEKNTNIMILFRVCESRYQGDSIAEEKVGLLSVIEKAFLKELKNLRDQQFQEEKSHLAKLQKAHSSREKKSSKKGLAFSVDSL